MGFSCEQLASTAVVAKAIPQIFNFVMMGEIKSGSDGVSILHKDKRVAATKKHMYKGNRATPKRKGPLMRALYMSGYVEKTITS